MMGRLTTGRKRGPADWDRIFCFECVLNRRSGSNSTKAPDLHQCRSGAPSGAACQNRTDDLVITSDCAYCPGYQRLTCKIASDLAPAQSRSIPAKQVRTRPIPEYALSFR